MTPPFSFDAPDMTGIYGPTNNYRLFETRDRSGQVDVSVYQSVGSQWRAVLFMNEEHKRECCQKAAAQAIIRHARQLIAARSE
jgi:hypothetical protein